MKHWRQPYSHPYNNKTNNNNHPLNQIIISNNKTLEMTITMLEVGLEEVVVEKVVEPKGWKER